MISLRMHLSIAVGALVGIVVEPAQSQDVASLKPVGNIGCIETCIDRDGLWQTRNTVDATRVPEMSKFALSLALERLNERNFQVGSWNYRQQALVGNYCSSL